MQEFIIEYVIQQAQNMSRLEKKRNEWDLEHQKRSREWPGWLDPFRTEDASKAAVPRKGYAPRGRGSALCVRGTRQAARSGIPRTTYPKVAKTARDWFFEIQS